MVCLFLVFLFACAIVDIRTKKIPCMWIYSGLAGEAFFAAYQYIWEERTLGNLFCAIIPGIISYIVAKISKALGEADALLILGMGLVFSVLMVARILMLALFLAAVASACLLVVKRTQKNKSIPFVPYLFLASSILLLG